jgi:hypothetical protein
MLSLPQSTEEMYNYLTVLSALDLTILFSLIILAVSSERKLNSASSEARIRQTYKNVDIKGEKGM